MVSKASAHTVTASDEALAQLSAGVVDLHGADELKRALSEGRQLVVKAGFDPTRPDLHLGHVVLLNKLRQFQTLGHEVVFIVGDFTAQIGDPSGRSATRPVPTREEILEGARTYAEQAFSVLDRDRTRIVYNSDWLNKLSFDDIIRLTAKYPLARMMERDDFKRRWSEHVSISIHELLYPLAQAYDSVEVRCDVELGGTDQLFNLLVGREIMRSYGLKPQAVMTTPILEGLNARVEDGQLVGDKMSKSLDNYVGVNEAPLEQFGKLMSVSDDLMWRYYELLSERPGADIQALRQRCAQGQQNPKEAKLALAREIVTRFHSGEDASEAERAWQAQFSARQVPTDMPECTVDGGGAAVWLPKALAAAELVPSSTEGRRRIQQGAVQVDGQRVQDLNAALDPGATYVVKAGKRAWAKITVT